MIQQALYDVACTSTVARCPYRIHLTPRWDARIICLRPRMPLHFLTGVLRPCLLHEPGNRASRLTLAAPAGHVESSALQHACFILVELTFAQIRISIFLPQTFQDMMTCHEHVTLHASLRYFVTNRCPNLHADGQQPQEDLERFGGTRHQISRSSQSSGVA